MSHCRRMPVSLSPERFNRWLGVVLGVDCPPLSCSAERVTAANVGACAARAHAPPFVVRRCRAQGVNVTVNPLV